MLDLPFCLGFSLVVVTRGLFSSCSVWASNFSGFSCCRAQTLGHVDFSSCSSHALEHRLNNCVGSSRIRGQNYISCIGRQILYHWATREAPEFTLKEKIVKVQVMVFSSFPGYNSRYNLRKRNVGQGWPCRTSGQTWIQVLCSHELELALSFPLPESLSPCFCLSK